MRIIKVTTQYKKDFKNYLKQPFYDEKRFIWIVELLANDAILPYELLDHPLKGNLKEFREIHIHPDYVLVYKKSKDMLILTLVRIGKHNNLFESNKR